MKNLNPELSIIIPAKNEAGSIGKLLASLSQQDYHAISTTEIIVADAGSTDATLEILHSFAGLLTITTVAGGLPSVGRNNGAKHAKSKYVLFIDADMELIDATLLRGAVETMNQKKLDLATTNIWAEKKYILPNLFYALSNGVQRVSPLFNKPFATGMFMMFDREIFWKLGGFDEHALYAEDYQLSRKINKKAFGIIPGSIRTSVRRFKKEGYFKMLSLFCTTLWKTWNSDKYFSAKEHKQYWK